MILADQVYTSLCTVALNNNNLEDVSSEPGDATDKDETVIDDGAQTENSTIQVATRTTNATIDRADSDSENVEARDSSVTNPDIHEPQKSLDVRTQYYAQLAGFASLRSAEKFVERAASKNITVLVHERLSHTSAGRSVVWYQVVTENYENRDALNSVVGILTKEEKLHGVRIIRS